MRKTWALKPLLAVLFAALLGIAVGCTSIHKTMAAQAGSRSPEFVIPSRAWISADMFPSLRGPYFILTVRSNSPNSPDWSLIEKDIQFSAVDSTGHKAPAPHVVFLKIPSDEMPVGTGDFSTGFRLDEKGMKPGMYTLVLTARAEVTAKKNEPVVDITPVTSGMTFYVPPAPDRLPQLVAGQRFMATYQGGDVERVPTEYRDLSTGKPILYSDLVTKTLTLDRILRGKDKPIPRLIFRLDGHRGEIYLDSDKDVTELPRITPLVSDPAVRDLKHRYEGKKVWCYGGAGGQCITVGSGSSALTVSGDRNLPMVIRRIERIYLPVQKLVVGTVSFMGGGDTPHDYGTSNPLVVLVDPPKKGLKFESFAAEGPIPSGNVIDNPIKYCLGIWGMCSDRWDFETTYSPVSLRVAGRNWPKKMMHRVMRGQVSKGMTHDMVAWTRGWPSIYGTTDELRKLNTWAYGSSPPGDDHVYFKNGRVSGFDYYRLP